VFETRDFIPINHPPCPSSQREPISCFYSGAMLWGLSAATHVWQPRYYDFNVCTPAKRVEKLRYMHRNLRGPQREPHLLSLG